MIHILRASDWLLKIMKDEKPFPSGILIHGFGGPSDIIKPLCDKNAFFSIAGNILFSAKTRAHKAVRAVPSDRILIETDAPDMPPPPGYCVPECISQNPNTRNEPANLPLIAAGIARLRNDDYETFMEQVYYNAKTFLDELWQ